MERKKSNIPGMYFTIIKGQKKGETIRLHLSGISYLDVCTVYIQFAFIIYKINHKKL